MDPSSKLLLDEMKKLGDRFALVEARVDSLEGSFRDQFKAVEQSASDLQAWRPGIDSSIADLSSKLSAVDDLHDKLGSLSSKLDRVVLDRLPPGAGILPNPMAAVATTPAGNPAVGPTGHCIENPHREPGFGSVTTISHLPVTGTPPDPPPLTSDSRQFNTYRFQSSSGPAMYTAMGRVPKHPFPKFTGANPKLWQSRIESYFDMYGVDRSMWVRFASMNFDTAAGRWLQSIERKISSMDWSTFCQLVLDLFGRDQHELLIRQLFHIKQTSSVADYVERFAELVDQLSAYTSNTDPLYYTLRFIDGVGCHN